MICGYRLVVTINGALSYYYDIQPFSSCPILWVMKDTLQESDKTKRRRSPKDGGRMVEAVQLIIIMIINTFIYFPCMRTKCEFESLQLLSFRSPCVWSPLAAWSSTHILHQTRRNCFPMSVNGSLCHYDNVQPRTPGSSLGSWAHFSMTRTQNIRETQGQGRSLSVKLPWNTAAWLMNLNLQK